MSSTALRRMIINYEVGCSRKFTPFNSQVMHRNEGQFQHLQKITHEMKYATIVNQVSNRKLVIVTLIIITRGISAFILYESFYGRWLFLFRDSPTVQCQCVFSRFSFTLMFFRGMPGSCNMDGQLDHTFSLSFRPVSAIYVNCGAVTPSGLLWRPNFWA